MYFLGIDGGGSQTRAWLSDEAGNIVGKGVGGPCNPSAQSAETCLQQLRSAINGALAAKNPNVITSVHLGVAGAGDASARTIVDSIADQLFDRSVTAVSISHDLKIAHAGGLGGQVGIALVAGTGSACYGVNLSGEEILTGGWGDLIDDAGGGAWIGLRALQLCVRQADGRAAGRDLQHGVLRFLELDSIDDFKKRIHLKGLTRGERAKLAPAVFELAESGDAAADQIVREAVHELTLLAHRNLKALGFEKTRLVVLGGLNESIFFRERLAASIQANMPGVAVSRPFLNATGGGVLLAMRAVGISANEAVLDQMRYTPK